jgi:hypothetical protein
MLALKGRGLNYEVDMMKDKYFSSSSQPSLENFYTSIITIKDSNHRSAGEAAVASTAAHIQ